MRIALLDPFYDDSHRHWAEGLRSNSVHSIDIYSLGPHHWKWKMTGGSLDLINLFQENDKDYDLILCTDMLNVPLFKAFVKTKYRDLPTILYFHENQITYPWSSLDRDLKKGRDYHYGFINFSSALLADKIIFNSQYHKLDFLIHSLHF